MNQQIDIYQEVEKLGDHFNKALTVKDIVWTKECGFAKQQLLSNDYLQKAAFNNVISLQHAIVNVASIGISLNPANKHAYLVPRDGRVCLDISYIGLLHLAMTSGSIQWGQAKLVYANDTYENNGIDKAPTHKQQTFGEKGEIIGAYCTVKLPSGDFLTEEMDIAALNKVKASSKAANGPWKTWPEEMMRKTVVKRASKYWPQSNRLNDAIDAINEHEGLQESEVNNKPYTDRQLDAYLSLLDAEDSLGVYLMQESLRNEDHYPENVRGLAFAYKDTAPKGRRMAYDKKASDLYKQGGNLCSLLVEHINNNDEFGVIELLEGSLPMTIKALSRVLTDEQLSFLNSALASQQTAQN